MLTHQAALTVTGGRRRRRSRGLAAGVAFVLATGVAVPIGAGAAQAAKPTCADEATDARGALAMADACAHRVEVANERSETNQTFANPDGTFTTIAAPVPVRARTAAGWKPVDTTLRRSGGAVSPAVVVEPLQLSDGGRGPLLTFGRPGARLSLTWPLGELPAPTLSGDTATYAEVLPGVDLQVKAGVAGFRQVLVVKSRQAAENPALREITFGFSGDGVRLRSKGRADLAAVDVKGNPVFVSTGGSMWDSPQPFDSQGAGAARGSVSAAERAASDGEPTPHRTAQMPLRVSTSGLTVVPDQAMLRAADTVYPVYIDPPFSKPSPVHWTNVMKSNPNHTYYGENSDMRVGRQWQTSDVWRSHMQFNISEMAGSVIVSASMHITADHTADCASTSIELWQTAVFNSPSTYTWYNDSDGDFMSRLDTESFSANESSCPKGDDPGEFTGTLMSKLQTQATNKASAMAFGLKAASESNDYEWTRFIASSVSFQATYNRPPLKPTDMAVSDCVSNCTTVPVVGRKDPELAVFATDPDAATILSVYFEVQTSEGVAVTSGVKTGYSSGPTKPAQPAKWRVTPLLGDGTYRWRARSKDEQGSYSPYTDWASFRTDTTQPLPPLVTASQVYQEDDGSGIGYGGIGVAGTVLAQTEADVYYVKWSLDNGPWTQVNTQNWVPCQWPCNSADQVYYRSAYITFIPTRDLMRTLTVRSYKQNGMYNTTVWKFRVAPPPPETGHWKLDGSGTDDPDLIEHPHQLDASTVGWTQSRYAPEFTQAEYTMASGARTLTPANAQVLALTGDDQVQTVTLPFGVPFYGATYTQAWVSTNGLLSFRDVTSVASTNGAIPSISGSSGVDLALYPFWTDLVVDANSSVRTEVVGTAPSRKFLVEWRNVAFYSDSTKRVTFEVQLGEDGTITFAYGDILAGDALETGGTATVGIENGSGLRGMQYSYNQQKLATGTGVTFTPTGVVAPAYPDGYYEARFTGKGGINTAGPVLATGVDTSTGLRRSFAVAAWVRVTDTTNYRTAVSQQGNNKSLFELGYQAGPSNNYCFKMFDSDATTAVGTGACATQPVVVGQWVHLAGVYDGISGTMTLYVHVKDADGFIDPAKTQVATNTTTTVWDALGAFTVGGAKAGAAFVGDVDEVWAWQRVPESSEIEFYAAN